MVPATKILRPRPPLRPPTFHQCVASRGSVLSRRRGRGPLPRGQRCSRNSPSLPGLLLLPGSMTVAGLPPIPLPNRPSASSGVTILIAPTLRSLSLQCHHRFVRLGGSASQRALCSCLRFPFIQIGYPPPAKAGQDPLSNHRCILLAQTRCNGFISQVPMHVLLPPPLAALAIRSVVRRSARVREVRPVAPPPRPPRPGQTPAPTNTGALATQAASPPPGILLEFSCLRWRRGQSGASAESTP